MANTWIILGATSSMARAFARAVVDRGDGVLLCGRDMEDLNASAADAAARGAPIAEAHAFDAREVESHGPIVKRAAEIEGQISVAVFVGSMPPQDEIDADPSLVAGTVADSFSGPAAFLTGIAELLEEKGGAVVGVGSVAGDRGRIGNYVYGAAKAGFHTYLAGLRNRLGRSGVHVVTVKPGFVDTAMTWGIEGMFLVASPDKVARDILRAVDKKRNVIYTPFFWWGIMTIIRFIPEPIFKKMSV
ncbi:MAG: SDR family NAD(P)-dependent oxidoreductase [Pseudomonadota bacterium]